ncbi:MAG TPA: efflux RND transporter periplasmic adaptor subunit [Gemmataceae bacterium]|jgi:HlyD family secretion protein|nr:efflux RND transporter periplasmic adaptor subunit [Gemmataceae bacterium]
MRRLLKWGLVFAFLFGGIAVAGFFGQQYLKAKSVPRFTTVEVSTGKIETVVNSTGPIKPVRTFTVGALVSGPLKDILVGYNDIVKKDQLLARIDPLLNQSTLDKENANLATQRAELARIVAQLTQAEKNEARAVKLQKTNKDYVSDQEMDQLHFATVALEAQKNLATANILAGEAGVKYAQKYLEYTEVRSPVDGIVIERKVEPGQSLASTYQTPELFIIAPDLDTMHVYAAVDEADIGQIEAAQKQNRPVKFTVDAHPTELFTGKIYQIRMNATTTQNVVTYPVIVEAANPGLKLKPQMTANVSFQTDVRENVTRIPMAALRFVPTDHLVRAEDKHYIELKPKKDPKQEEEKLSAERRAEQAKERAKRVVWVAEGTMVVAVPVTIGLQDGQFAELVSGDIKPGQALVTGFEGEDARARR